MDTVQALVHHNIRVGYLHQLVESGLTKTGYEEARSEIRHIEDARIHLEEMSKIREDSDYSEKALKNLSILHVIDLGII